MNILFSRQSARRRQVTGRRLVRGVSLIEILVSVLILSFGVLAMVSMMNVASRYNKTSEFRSVAVLLANDYADRIRANDPGKDQYALAVAAYAAKVAATVPGCTATDCTVTEIASIDKVQWMNAVVHSLPGGAAYAQYDAANESYNLWVAWQDPSADESPRANLECPTLVTSGAIKPRCMFFRIGI